MKKIHVESILSIERCELHNCLRNVMRLCRWFGFFPVVGLDSPLTNKLRFDLKSAYGVYFIATIFGQVVIAACYLYSLFTDKLSLIKLTFTVFYVSSLLTGIFLWNLAKHWPSLLMKAKKIEQCVTELKISKNIPLKLRAVAYSMLLLALVENLLSLLHLWNIMLSCSKDDEKDDLLLKFYTLRMPSVLQLFCPVTLWSGIFYQIVNFQATFLWNFLDVMIICISMYLTEYFKELNNIMKKHKIKTAAIWEKIRITHCSLVTLVKVINRRFSHCVLLAVFTDLYFICVQLFNVLGNTGLPLSNRCSSLKSARTQPGPIQYVYYSYSFLFLIVRVSLLSMVAANVNSVALRPRMALGEVAASIQNIGIQRFLRQLNYTTIAISGWFFYVTRDIILKIVGTIITYELVLLQYKHLKKVTDEPPYVNNTTEL